ncbi:MAG: bifunctional folylpolyglutamate synthase/dihydrofolate synthase [Firmicutes bacterium HGW-Firmicutes-13]|nr:MAG: bifunctional folylpolyglutamate synthase/dihydrofolate synthase [Firmicutes bacterium HGW-Firmicutes-13]
MNYQEALNWIHSIGRFGIKPGLQRMTRMMELMDNPHKKLKVIHIAGTNGKGSTAAFVTGILEEAGFRVGLYTSPYLEAFTNRMSISGQDIPRGKLVKIVEMVKPLVDQIAQDSSLGQMTEFEVVTSIAFKYFAEEEPDFVVLEVGLGGRLDATNVVEDPLAAVITNIGLEHTEILGDTIEKIAGEKAGIIKEGGRVVTAAQNPEALEVIKQKCSEKKASLFNLREKVTWERFSTSLEGQYFSYHNPEGLNLDNLFITLLGEHQVINAVTAVAVIESLKGKGIIIESSFIREGLKKTLWAGRLEIMGKEPLLMLDAAHNIEGVKSLRKALTEQIPYKKLILVMGILGDKAVDEMLKEIVPIAHKLIITRPENPRAGEPEEVAAAAGKFTSQEIIIEKSIPLALKIALSLANSEDLVLVSGSLYTISEARKALVECI